MRWIKELFGSNKKKKFDDLVEPNTFYSVETFNHWFNLPKKDVYANKGIFLRLDKLSDSMVFDYLKHYGVVDPESMIHDNSNRYFEFRNFILRIREDWLMQIKEKNSVWEGNG